MKLLIIKSVTFCEQQKKNISDDLPVRAENCKRKRNKITYRNANSEYSCFGRTDRTRIIQEDTADDDNNGDGDFVPISVDSEHVN